MLPETIDLIKSLGCKAGIALNPATSTSVLENIIQDIDLVLLMSVYPGFGGQKFIPSTLKKIQDVKAMIDLQDNDIYLEVDGGINLETIARSLKQEPMFLLQDQQFLDHQIMKRPFKVFVKKFLSLALIHFSSTQTSGNIEASFEGKISQAMFKSC